MNRAANPNGGFDTGSWGAGAPLALVGLGRLAAEALSEPGPARVAASFRRSFYLESCRGGLVCIGGREIGCGPLNALAGTEAAAPLLSRIPFPEPARAGAGGRRRSASREGGSDMPPRAPDRGNPDPEPPHARRDGRPGRGKSTTCAGAPAHGAGRPGTAARFPPLSWRDAGGYGGSADRQPVVRPGHRAAILPGGIVFAGGLRLTFAGAALWEPPPPPPVPCPDALREILAALRRWIGARNGSDCGIVLPVVLGSGFETRTGIGSTAGSGAGVGGDGREPGREAPDAVAARHLRRGMRAMTGWLAAGWGRGRPPAEDPPSEAAALIGLGPGLTPAGDDFIGGALLALHALGRARLAERLGSWVLAESPGRTGIVSRAHLRAAARGMGADPIHRALHSLLIPTAPGLGAVLEEAAAIGHSSGLDTLAGAAAVLDVAARRFSSALSR